MRAIATTATLLLLVTFSGPATAEGLNNLYAGANGLMTFLADPVLGVVEPPEAFRELPGAVVTAPFLGLFSGVTMCAYRATMGALDVVFTPFWVFPTLSPEPRWEIIKDVDYN